ncbi:hypothetical protein R75461_07873 [Paraburkholderia nemoris]|nr:hypothetical protein R75461_07873 [Paraburkholderia nemoris]
MADTLVDNVDRNPMSRAIRFCFIAAACMGPVTHVDAGTIHGWGRYHYRYTLRDSDGKAMPNARFALSVTHDLPFVTDRKKVWLGWTDSRGRTPRFALPYELKPDDALLRPRIGRGPNGEQMQYIDQFGRPVTGFPYRLVLCTVPPLEYSGLTDRRGYTAYGASARPVTMQVFERDVTDHDEQSGPSDCPAEGPPALSG